MPRSKYARKSTRPSFRRKTTRRTRASGPFRKKRFSKYRIAGNSGVGRGISSAVFPQRLFKTFQYSSAAQKLQQTLTDIPVSSQFRGNSVYDPDYTGIGSQPRWVDTFLGANETAAPYLRYTVLASKIIVNIWQDPKLTGTVGSTAGLVSILPMAGTSGVTPPASLKEMQERAFIRTRSVGNANSHSPLTLKHYCKTKALWQGMNPLSSTEFSSVYNNNPQREWSWVISAVNIISGTGIDLFSCFITVRIKYYCMLSTLNDVANS